MTDAPYFCRLEYLTRDGWQLGHAGVSLLHPERYVERLTERGKFGRCTVLGDDLEPVQVFVSPNLPEDPSILVPSGIGAHVLPCRYCGQSAHDGVEGMCMVS